MDCCIGFFFWSWLIMYMQFWKAFSFFSNDTSIKSNVWKIYHISKLCKNAVIITFKLKRNTTHLKELSKILNFNLFYYLVYSGNSITLNTHLMTWVNKQRIALIALKLVFIWMPQSKIHVFTHTIWHWWIKLEFFFSLGIANNMYKTIVISSK